MNRNDEYSTLKRELDAMEVPADTVSRALRRKRRRDWMLRPLGSVAAVLVLFVALVNVSSTVADACGNIPVLRELARAVCFSRSLADAVDNDYVQPVKQSQTVNGVTATVEYLIVDQKQVNVFFRLDAKQYSHLRADTSFRMEEGVPHTGFASFQSGSNVENGQLQSATVDFGNGSVPERLRFFLKVRDLGNWQTEAVAPTHTSDAVEPEAPEYLAEFEFLLEFDPYFTEQGRHTEADIPFTIDGQTFRIRSVDVYPSHLNLTVEGDETNSAWLEDLDFYVVTDRGERFDMASDGITAMGSEDSPEMVSYRADSPFFYEADGITLYITGAEWLEKDRETIHVDLANGRADAMPEGAELIRTEQLNGGWVVTIRRTWKGAQTFMGTFYDEAGNSYEMDGYSYYNYGEEEPEDVFYEDFPLRDYPYDQVWLTPRYTQIWETAEPVTVEIDLA